MLATDAQEELNKRKTEAARVHLLDFTTYTFGLYQPDPAHRLIASTLEKLIKGAAKRLMVFAPPQHGKAIEINTPIPTPWGYQAIADLRPGDVVFDETGHPCHVVARSPVWRNHPVFKVSTDDGDSIIADAEHEWMVRLCRKHKALTVRTTNYLAQRTSERRPMINRQGSLLLPEQILPIDPYVIGLWLGDGDSSAGSITSSHVNDRYFVRQQIEQAGYQTRIHDSDERDVGILGLQRQLRLLGLLRNKHIPSVFLWASESQRLALLQGLIDADGYVAKGGQIEFSNTNRNLADGVRQLVHSLGYKASLIMGRATLYGKDCGVKYRVMFYMPNAARLPRKRDRCIVPSKHPNRYIDIEPAGEADTVCIQVDAASHMFLCGKSMLPTHNSQLASVHLPAFWMAKRPDDPVILTSYAASLAYNKSREARNLVESTEYGDLFPEVETDRASRAVDHWELAPPRRGGMLAAGVGGPITGHGAALGIIDDPFENWQQAHSQTIRDRVWDWYRTTFRTRVWENGAIVLIMTRWHEDDLAGRILQDQGDQWTVLRLPALGETQQDRDQRSKRLGLKVGQPDPVGRKVGEPLCPTRFSAEALAELRRDVGSLAWEGQYMGSPTLPEGNRFKRPWFPIVDAAPAKARRVRYWDLAGSEARDAARTAGVRLAITADRRIFVEDAVFGRWSTGKRNQVIRQTAELDGREVRVRFEQEPGSSGLDTARAMVKLLQGFGVKPDKVTGSKDVRLEPFAAQAEAGNVALVRGDWNGPYIEEMCAIPNGRYRDMGDGTAGAYNDLTRAGGGVWRG